MDTVKATSKKTETDGRKLRTTDSRQKIVDAFLKLVYEGNVSPSAEEVATAANVSLSTVFRRFTEMELLYRELIIEVQTKFLPKFLIPFESTDWRGQIHELVKRRAAAYELLMPYRVATKVLMHRSTFIKDNIERWTLMQKKQLEFLLPFSEIEEPLMFAGIEASISFDTWIQIRSAQKLSGEKAEALMMYMLELVLSNFQEKSNKD